MTDDVVLTAVVRDIQAGSVAPDTRKQYTSTFKDWLLFLNEMGLGWKELKKTTEGLEEALCKYSVACVLGRKGRNVSGKRAKGKISAILHYCRLDGLNVNLFSFPKLQMVLAGCKEYRGGAEGGKEHMTLSLMKAMKEEVFRTTPHGLGDVVWSLCVLQFCFLMRVHELFGKTKGGQFNWYALEVRDLILVDAQGNAMGEPSKAEGIRILFRGSKTDRVGEGTTRTLGRSKQEWMCPVVAATRLLQYHLGVEGETKLARLHEVVSSSDVNRWIKAAAGIHGLNKKRYASHSVRAGGATALYKGGADLLLIQYFGRWTSEAYRVYCRLDERDSARVMTKMFIGLGLSVAGETQ